MIQRRACQLGAFSWHPHILERVRKRQVDFCGVSRQRLACREGASAAPTERMIRMAPPYLRSLLQASWALAERLLHVRLPSR